jgi:hypothetical protein
MLIDNKINPFGAAITPQERDAARSQGILNIEVPQNAPMAQDPSITEQGVGILKNKALEKGTEMATGAATTAIESAAAGAGKGGAAAGAAGGAAGTGLMAAAAPMAAPLLIGGLLATKLFK